jgi:hypothetical protein
MIKSRPTMANQNAEQQEARKRMALFPDKGEILYVAGDMWVVRMLSNDDSSLL